MTAGPTVDRWAPPSCRRGQARGLFNRRVAARSAAQPLALANRLRRVGKDVVDHGALAVPVRAKVVGAGTPLGVQALADLRFLGESSSLWKIIQRVVLKT